MNLLLVALFGAIIKFTWTAPAQPPNVATYKVCADVVPGGCAQTVTVNAPNTTAQIDLDLSKVWYAFVKASNEFGDSAGSTQVVVGKPQPPAGLAGSL